MYTWFSFCDARSAVLPLISPFLLFLQINQFQFVYTHKWQMTGWKKRTGRKKRTGWKKRTGREKRIGRKKPYRKHAEGKA